MKTIFQKDWAYAFYKNDNDELILSVVCGTVALFEIDIVLAQSEINAYHEGGQDFIDSLAKKITRNPEEWQLRKIN